MNVAVAVADRVYVMETGAVRFSGSADELAAHPELLWSVYLAEGIRVARPPQAVAAPAAATGRRHELEVRGDLAQLRRQRRARRRVAARRPRRDRRHHRAQRRRQDDALRRHLGVPPPRRRAGRAGRRRRHRSHGVGPGPARPGPLLPGLAPVLRAHRARRAGRLARALHRRRRPLQRHAAPARCRCGPRPPSCEPGRRAHRPVRPRPLRRQPGERAVDRLPPPGRPGRRAWPTSRRSSCSTSPPRAWPSARSRPWSGCCATCGTGSTPPCSSSSTTSRSSPSWPTAWWPWTAARVLASGAAARRARVARGRARPSSAPTRSPCRARAPSAPESTTTEVDPA